MQQAGRPDPINVSSTVPAFDPTGGQPGVQVEGWVPDDKTGTWIKLFYELVQQRTPATVVLTYVQSVQVSSWAISPRSVVSTLLANSYHGCNVSDPLIWEYLQILQEHDLVRTDDIICSIFERSVHRLRMKRNDPTILDGELLTKLRQSSFFVPSELECDILESCAGIISSPSRPWEPWTDEVVGLLDVLGRWLPEICLTDGYSEIKALLLPEYDPTYSRSHEFFDSIGTVLIALLQNPDVTDMAATDGIPKAVANLFGNGVIQFSSFWMAYSPALATKLDALWRANPMCEQPPALDQTSPVAVAVNLPAELPYQHSRSGMLVFLNSLMVSPYPLTDDALVLNYLAARYQGDPRTMGTQLIIATFDLLANGMYRNETPDVMFALRSFAINKLPVLLSIMSASMTTAETIDLCITNGLAQIDPHVFPSFSESFMMGQGKTLTDVRQDFISACHLHGLVSADAKADVFGDRLLDSSPTTDKKLEKNELVKKYRSSMLDQIGVLIEGLESLDGNAAVIVHALVEIAQSLGGGGEMSGLKRIASAVSRKTFFLDVIFQFSSPAAFLRPFCDVLDRCKYDDEETEFQPVYDDFSAIMLMVQSFLTRFQLTPADVGIASDSFIGKYMNKDSVAKLKLSERNRERLSLWTRGLFDLDGSIDDAMAQCLPQQFYLLVPELFREIIDGIRTGAISSEALKSGFDYLFESFLVPAIVDGISWLCRHSDAQPAAIVPLLQRLMMKPTSRSGDAPAMHRTVLAITGAAVHSWLTDRLGQDPAADPAVRRMLETAQTVSFYDSRLPARAEMNSWMTCTGGIAAALCAVFDSLVRWHLHPSQQQQQQQQNGQPLAIKYSHRHFLAASDDVIGPSQVADLLIERVSHYFTISQTHGQIAIDVAVSLVSAPSATNNGNINNPFRTTWPATPVMAPVPATSLEPDYDEDGDDENSNDTDSDGAPFASIVGVDRPMVKPSVADFLRLKRDRSLAPTEATFRICRELDLLTARGLEQAETSAAAVIAYFAPHRLNFDIDPTMSNLMAMGRQPDAGPSIAAAVAAAAAAAGSVAGVADGAVSWINPGQPDAGLDLFSFGTDPPVGPAGQPGQQPMAMPMSMSIPMSMSVPMMMPDSAVPDQTMIDFGDFLADPGPGNVTADASMMDFSTASLGGVNHLGLLGLESFGFGGPQTTPGGGAAPAPPG